MHGADERLVEIHIVAFTMALVFWVGPDVLGVLTALHLAVWVQGVRDFGFGFVKTTLYFGCYFGDY